MIKKLLLIPQNLLYYFMIRLYQRKYYIFLKKYNLEKNISQSNFNVNYITSNRLILLLIKIKRHNYYFKSTKFRIQ